MANAAAKKAAAAKQQAASFFRPLLLGINAFYILLRYYLRRGNHRNYFIFFFTDWTPYEILSLTCIGAIQMYSYRGILERSSHPNTTTTTAPPLAGGGYLDALAFAFVIQFAALYFSSRLYILLGLFPIWGAMSMYQTLGRAPGTAGKKSIQPTNNTNISTSLDRKPTKTEKRRKKQM